ncbi:hypothetical protein F7734_19595 [Scytonema sp. UIC 10036]|uniref:hypothetical protein n=1 Tax=Scytonema sp. UIC 10036 TaxID=2304196 RepID=UPI0012DA4BD0|nr:hypothetical protein [Scytonema sp. UIC 10036]MUG94460.1 hypothetical protein [Scytonema sp. UIC 10036]
MNQEKVIIVEQTLGESPQESASKTELVIPSESVFLIPLFFLLVFSIAFLKQTNFTQALYQRIVSSKLYSRIPCFKCQFFKQNQYLQCAVQPCLVMTKSASECPDYVAIRSKK